LLAGILALLFIVTAVAAFLFFNMARVMTDRQAVKQALNGRVLLGEVATTVLRQAIRDRVAAEGVPVAIQESPALDQAIDNLVPPDWAQSQTDGVIDALFNYLESGEETALAIRVEMGPLFDSLRGPAGLQAVTGILQSLPTCSDALPPVSLDPNNIEIPSCLPPGFDVAPMAAVVHQAVIAGLDSGAPAVIGQEESFSFDLLGTPDATGSAEMRQSLTRVRQLYLLTRRGSWLLWLLPLGCLFLVLLFGVRSAVGFGHWLGWPMLLAALIALFIAFVVPFAFGSLFSLLLTPAAGDEAAVVAQRFLDATLGAMSGVIFARVKVQAALLAVAGLFLIGIGVVAGMMAPPKSG
jgi:hypothetical protein